MANRFPLFVEPVSQTVRELPAGDNLNLTGSNIVVNTDRVLTLPTTEDTLVGRDTNDTLTNKTLTQPVLGVPRILDSSEDHRYIFGVSELTADRTITLPLLSTNDEFVFKAHSQTLSNKTIDSADNTITLDLSEITFSGTIAEFNSALSDGSFATLDGEETLTNKTLTSATLNSATADDLTLTGTLTAGGSAGTAGYLLKSTGTGVEWVPSSESISILDDGSTNSDFYPTFVPNSTGVVGDVTISSTKVSFNPSTGTFKSTVLSTDNLKKANGNEMLFVPKYNAQVTVGDGTTTAFTLNSSVTNEQELLITVGGIPQTPGSGYSYTASGTTLTFSEAPNPDDRIVIRYLVYKVR
jgi:hypothetical protein